MSASVKSSSLLRKRRPADTSAVFLKAQEMINSTLSVAHAVESKLKDLESRFESIDAVQRTLAASLRPGLPVELPVWLGTSQIAALRELRPPPPGVLVESADMRVKCTAIIRIVKNAAGRLHAVERRAQELFIQYLGLATAQQGLQRATVPDTTRAGAAVKPGSRAESSSTMAVVKTQSGARRQEPRSRRLHRDSLQIAFGMLHRRGRAALHKTGGIEALLGKLSARAEALDARQRGWIKGFEVGGRSPAPAGPPGRPIRSTWADPAPQGHSPGRPVASRSPESARENDAQVPGEPPAAGTHKPASPSASQGYESSFDRTLTQSPVASQASRRSGQKRTPAGGACSAAAGTSPLQSPELSDEPGRGPTRRAPMPRKKARASKAAAAGSVPSPSSGAAEQRTPKGRPIQDIRDIYPGAIDDHPYRAITGKDKAIKVFYRVKKKQFEEPKATTRRSLPLNMDQKAIDVTLKGGRKTKQIPFRDLYLGAEEGRTSFAVYDKKRHGPGLKTKRVELHGEGAVTAVMTNREGVLK